MGPIKYSYNSQCRGKRQYVTKAYAKNVAKRIQSLGGAGAMRAYRCPYCTSYHVGHDPGAQSKHAANLRVMITDMLKDEPLDLEGSFS
jgi:hypothetical protein